MSEPIERQTLFRPSYVIWMSLFVVGFSCLQFVIAAGLYCAIYGTPEPYGLVTLRLPEFNKAVMWHGNIWYPVQELRRGVQGNDRLLLSFDPEKDGDCVNRIQISAPVVGMLPQGDRLWVVSANMVTLVEGKARTEIKPTRTLVRISDPFLYQNQLAVIDMGTRGPPTLLVLQNSDWVDFGTVVIPFAFKSSTIEGKTVLIPDSATSAGRSPLTDVQVISHGDQLHLFAYDGNIVIYKNGLDLAPVSALAPANETEFADLSNLAEWEIACDSPPNIYLGPESSWKASLVKGEPIVLTMPSSDQNPFRRISLFGYRRIAGAWHEFGKITVQAGVSLLVTNDGQTTYFTGQTPQIRKITDTEMLQAGSIVDTGGAGFRKPVERWRLLFQWVYWPGLLLFSAGVTRLMNVYRIASYQFGNNTVELASFMRRAMARVVDYLPFCLNYKLVQLAFGFSSQIQQSREMDSDPAWFMAKIAWMTVCQLICFLLLLSLNSWLQGRWGLTLGKWICGIRTVRSTLRPCGFLRAILRELLLIAESIASVTYIPASLMIALTSCRQRVGDKVADTIVIRKRD